MIYELLENKNKNSSLLAIALSSSASLLLLAIRMIVTGKLTYIFFAWNLFLGWIPLFAALMLPGKKSGIETFIIFVCWLAFLPNSPYIITDIIHFRPRGVPLWYDMVLVFSFAWNGLIAGFISLYMMHRFLNGQFGKIQSWGIVAVVLLLCGFGMYLGRYERWNSWDMLLNPFDLLASIFYKIIHPVRYKETYGITLLFSGFLFCCYITLLSFTQIPKEKND